MGITLGGRYDYGELRWRITVEMSGTGEGQCNSFRNQKVDSESEKGKIISVLLIFFCGEIESYFISTILIVYLL
jgi:hypothetical protein